MLPALAHASCRHTPKVVGVSYTHLHALTSSEHLGAACSFSSSLAVRSGFLLPVGPIAAVACSSALLAVRSSPARAWAWASAALALRRACVMWQRTRGQVHECGGWCYDAHVTFSGGLHSRYDGVLLMHASVFKGWGVDSMTKVLSDVDLCSKSSNQINCLLQFPSIALFVSTVYVGKPPGRANPYPGGFEDNIMTD